MNNLVPAAPAGFAEAELTPFRRFTPQPTPLEQVAASVYRQRQLAGLIFLATLLVGALITYYSPRQFTAFATVNLEQQAPRVLADAELDPLPNVADSDRFLQTQLDRVRSRNLAEGVIAKLGPTKSSALVQALGLEPAPRAEQREQVIAGLQERVDAQLGLNTRLARISFTSGDPNMSAQVANAFADALVTSNLDAKFDASTKAKQYLQGQLGQAKGRLEGSERTMLAYARSADLTTTVVASVGDKENRVGSLRAQQLGLLTANLTDATARRIDAEQTWLQVRGTSPMSLPDVQTNGAVQTLVAQKAAAEAALQQERQRHTDAYPSVREAAAKIQTLNSQIGSVAQNIKNSFYGRYAAATQQERQLAGNVAGLRNAAMAERERSVGYNSLQREVETNRAFYEGLLQRYKEVAAASGALVANITVLDHATAPLEPSAPNVTRNMALAGMTGIILALMFGAVRERMHRVIRSVEDVEDGLDLPVLGVVPLLGGRKSMKDALEDPRSAQSEAYNSIAVALDETSPGAFPKTLLITSSAPSEGKSTTAVGLARSFADMGKRVLLVDGDLRHPSLRKLMGDMDGPGLSDALLGTAEGFTIILRDEDHGFDVVGAGQSPSNPIALLSTHGMSSVLERLGAEHDVVVIDGPPILGLADAVLLGRSVTAILLVAEANRTDLSQLEMALARLGMGNVVGGIITKFDPKAAGVSYGRMDYYAY
ncbi:MAG: polysaccharide biosynthesis tyrosine autokinase [Sphingomicrobium sp.]